MGSFKMKNCHPFLLKTKMRYKIAVWNVLSKYYPKGFCNDPYYNHSCKSHLAKAFIPIKLDHKHEIRFSVSTYKGYGEEVRITPWNAVCGRFLEMDIAVQVASFISKGKDPKTIFILKQEYMGENYYKFSDTGVHHYKLHYSDDS